MASDFSLKNKERSLAPSEGGGQRSCGRYKERRWGYMGLREWERVSLKNTVRLLTVAGRFEV